MGGQRDDQAWTSDWTEGGGETPTSATAGAIQINTTARPPCACRIWPPRAKPAARIQRSHNISGATFARLQLPALLLCHGLDANDRIAADVSTNGTTWTTLQTYVGPWFQTHARRLSRARGVQHQLVHRQPDLHPLPLRGRSGERRLLGDRPRPHRLRHRRRLRHERLADQDLQRDCTGTPIAVAYGQYPSLTGSNDDEALDLGTLVPPYRPIVRLGSIGNYVWLDEDGDGDQDAGEAGIPNVKVTLTGTASDGYRLQPDHLHRRQRRLPLPGPQAEQRQGYTVTVDPTTPAGRAGGNPTYDENGIGHAAYAPPSRWRPARST